MVGQNEGERQDTDLQMSLCVTTRGGGGGAGRHLLGGEGLFTLPIGLERIHINYSVVDGRMGEGSRF